MIPLKIWALASLLLSLASGQLVNLIQPTTVTGTDITSLISSAWSKDKINDGDFSTTFGQSGTAVGYIYVDFGSVQTIKTILITQYIGVTSGVLYDIYIGNVSGTGTYVGINTLCCNQCNPSGFLTCEGSGQYLILDNYPGGDSFRISELFAFNEPLATTQLTNAIPTFMSVQSANVAAFPNIFRDHDGVVNSCTNFDVSLDPPYLTFDLPQMSQVSYVMLQMDGSISAQQVDIDIYDASLTWQPCSQMDFTSRTWDQSSCASLGGTKIKMTFTVNPFASNELRKVCKIGVFGQSCSTMTPVVTENPWTVSTTTFNLLQDTSITISLPSLTITPTGCFSNSWKVYDQLTSTDQEVGNSPFSTGATNLIIVHNPNLYAKRLLKFSFESAYYFKGTLDDSVPTVTSQFNFNIVFQDDCRTATISAQTITFPNAEWSVQTTQSISVPAFGDSVELGSYAQGTCGEKDIVLNSPPAFISLTKGTNPLTDPFTIDYDQTAATEADIGTHTISYTVTMTEYAALTTPITGSFTFEIECPQVVPSVTEGSWTASTTTIDLLQDTSATVTLPTVTFSPANCFSLTWKSHDQATNSDLMIIEPATFSLSATDLTISHTPTDFAQRLAKYQWATTYYFEGTLDDSALTKTSQFNFNIVFQDACRTATISAKTITVPNVEWYFKSTQSTSVPAFGDSVELGSYAQGTCGEKDIVLNSPPAFISLTKGTNPLTDPFTIDYDQTVATEADIGIHTITGTVTMTEYAALTTPITGSFTFEIECPILVATFNLDVPIVAYSDYDVASNSTLSLTPPLVSVNPSQCHSVTAYTVVDSATQVQPDYLTMSALSYDIISSNRTLVSIHTLSLNAVISNGQTIQVQTFSVNFFDSCNATTFIENQKAQTVEIGALSTAIKTINLASFTDQVSLDYGLTNTCGNFTYQVLAPESAFASVAHVEGSVFYEVTFDTKDYSKSGKQTVKVEVGLVNYPLLKSQAQITVDVKPIANPFVPPAPLEENEKVEEQPLPEIIEDEIQPEITPPPVVSIPDPIQVKVLEEADLLADAIRQGVSEDQISFPNPVPYISSVSQTGLVQIKFTKPLKEISDQINLNTLEFEIEPKVWMPVLQFYIEPAEAQDPNNVAMTWSILKFDSNQMDVQLYFEQPLYVSFEDEPDILVANFADEELFITENGIKILPDNRILRRKLRRQLPASAQGVQDTIDSSAENTKTTTILILAGNIFLAVGLQQLFSMISALQIIIILPLFNSKMPANTGTFFGQLMQIAAFDLFELDPYINEYLDMQPSDPINEKFETIGLESIYFMNNLGTFTVVIILKLQLIILWILLMMPAGCFKKVTKVRDRLGRKIFWNSWLVAVIESFLIISLCIAISFKHSIYFDSFGEIVQSSFCIGCLLIYSLLPLFTLFKVIKDFREIGNSSMMDVFGAFYIEIQIKHGKKVLIYPTLQLLRRVFLVYIVIYGTQVFYYQMVLMMAATLILAFTSYLTESFKTKYDQRLYTFTTMTIMVTCYSFVCFDIVDVETNFTAGYVPIGVISFYIVVVLCMIIFSALKVIRRKIQLKCAQRSHKRQRKLLKGYLTMNHATRKARLQARLRPTIFQQDAPDKEVSASIEDNSNSSRSGSSQSGSSGSSESQNSSSSQEASQSSSSSSSPSDSSSFKTDPELKSSDDIQHLVDEILLDKQNELKSLSVSKPTRYALKQVMPESPTDEDINYAINTLEELKAPQRMVATQPRSRELSLSAEQNNLMQTSLQSLKHKMAVKRESQRSMIQTDIDVIMDQVDDILGPQPYSKQGGAMVPHFEKERYSIETQDVVPQRYSKAAHERGRNSQAQVTQKPLIMKSKIRQRIQVAQPEPNNHLQEFQDERNNTYDKLDARVRRRLRIVNLHEKKNGQTSFEQWQKNQYKPSFK